MSEIERIRSVYDKRVRTGREHAWNRIDPANLYLLQRRERALIGLLHRRGLSSLGHLRILDIGCGSGDVLRDFLRYGARPQHLHGIDVLPERIAAARERSAPGMQFSVGSATDLLYPAGYFDIALQFTVLSSVLDAGMRAGIASETMRVLRPGGTLIWYDFTWNPTNRDVRGIGLNELRTLYAGCIIDARRVTLAPPIARPVARSSWALAAALEALPFLRSHLLAAVPKL